MPPPGHSARCRVGPSRTGFAIWAVSCLGLCCFGIYSWVAGFGKDEEVVRVIGAAVMGGLAVLLAVGAIRPPTVLILDDEGAEFVRPPLTVAWRDVQALDISPQGSDVTVDFTVADIDRYLARLTAAQRQSLTYETGTRLLRLTIPKHTTVSRLRDEMVSRWQRVRPALHDAPQAVAAPLPDEGLIFSVRFLAALVPDRYYRVYSRDGGFFMIRVSKAAQMDAVPAHLGGQLGLLGGLLVALLIDSFKGDTTPADEIAAMDRTPPASLLGRHRHNFTWTPRDVVEATLDPPAAAIHRGPNVGRMTLVLRDRGRQRYQFEDMRSMRLAVQHLPGLLGPALKLNVRWDEAKGRFVNA